MAGTLKLVAGPAFIANTATDIYTPPASTIYTVIRHIHVANKTAGAVTFRLYLGATGANAAGTEIMGFDTTVAANSYVDWYPPDLKLKVADFLVGGASANTSLTIMGTGEYGLEF